MSKKPIRLILILCFWVCALAPDALAQRATGSLRLSVQARNVALVKDGEVQLHWVLAKLPEAGDIVLLPTADGTPADETFLRELNAVLLGLAARKGTGEGSCLEIVVEERATPPGCSLRDTLRNVFDRPRRFVLAESGKPDPRKTKPAVEGAAPEDRIAFGYLMGVTTTLISGLRVELETAYAQAAATGNTISRPLNIPPDLLPKGFSAGTVSVTALYAQQDRYPGAGAQGADLFTDEQVATALTEVAVAVLRAGFPIRLRPGPWPPRLRRIGE
ncbi:MAG: hypothetical protein NTW28_36780 [Candidatus Solibacter sp.]|nr:hypothetical protein [Candidatus Solibacter sp.]